jgi:NTE family protein
MDPIRHISHTRPHETTLAGEIPPGTWRYSSRLALVLSGGGARGAYHVGVLAGFAERLPGLEFPIVTGVSVGAINAAYLAAHPDPLPDAVAGLQREWRRLTSEQVYRMKPTRLVRSVARWMWQGLTRGRGGVRDVEMMRGLVDTQPLREFLAGCLNMDAIALKVATGRLRAVALSAVSYATGRTVTFVQGGVGSRMWERSQRHGVQARLTLDHVMASAAVPILFPAVRMGEEFFGDGSVGAVAPLAPAIHLGARGIVAIGTPAARLAPKSATSAHYPSIAEVMGLLFRAIFLDALESDVERLERVNRLLAGLPGEAPFPDGLRPIELLLIRPSRSLSELAAGRDGLLPPAMHRMIRAIGGGQAAGSEFLAYLLFHPEYTSPLAELGYHDVAAQWPAIERFFERLERRRA